MKPGVFLLSLVALLVAIAIAVSFGSEPVSLARAVLDSTSLDLPAEDFTSQLGRDLKGVKLGIPKEYFVDGMDARIRAKVEEAIRQCESAGAELA